MFGYGDIGDALKDLQQRNFLKFFIFVFLGLFFVLLLNWLNGWVGDRFFPGPYKYSERQKINTIHPLFGGSQEINLDNAGRLYLYDLASIEETEHPSSIKLATDSSVVSYADEGNESGKPNTIISSSIGEENRIVFDDRVNTRKSIEVSNRTFLVTLLNINGINHNGKREWEFEFQIQEL